MNKKIIIPVLVAASAVAITVGATQASAYFFGDNTDMTKTLAQKLGVSEDKVKEAFDSIHKEQEATHKKELESRLTQAVSDGKINDSQKKAILERFDSMHEKMDPEKFKNMTEAQRKSEFENKKTEQENWAKENNIDQSTLRELMGFGKKGGMGFGMRRHM